MSIAVLQDKIRARKTPLALVLSPEADKLNPKITKNFTDLYGPGDMAEAEALRYHGSQLIGQAASLLPAVVLRAERYLRCGFMGMDVLANLVNMAKTQGLYTIVDARTSAPEVYTAGGIHADGVTVTPYPGRDVCRAALMAETGYSLDVKELRARAPRAFLLLLGCDGENALPAFDDYGRGALLGDDTLQYADADAIQAAVRQLKQLVTVL